MKTPPLILASTSQSRKEMLTRTGVQFTVEPSDYEEDMTIALAPHEMVQLFSREKARAVAKRHTEGIVVGADSVAVLDGKAIGKPKDEAEARAVLQSLSGREHIFLTGFTVIDIASNTEITKTEETVVTFKKLTPEEIDTYIKSGEPLNGHAGAYAAQSKGAALIEKIEGEFTTSFGLPLCSLNTILQQFGISLLS